MGVSSDIHASSTSATNTPEAFSQIKKQRTCQIPEQKSGTVETQKDRRTYLRVWSHSKKTQKISQNQKTIRSESFQ